jgi:hypothetical protein
MTYFSTDHIKPYRKYADWASHEASVKPIRGRTEKPLARRRDWRMSIERVGEDIVLRENCYWKNSLQAVYQKDGTLKLVLPNGSSTWHSTNQRFINATTGIRVYKRGGRNWLDTGHDRPVLLDLAEGVVTFKRNPEDTRWVLAKEGSTGTHYTVNRKALNAVKKRVKPYMTQLEIFLKLKSEHVTLTRRSWARVPEKTITLSLVDASESTVGPRSAAYTDRDLCIQCMESDDPADWYTLHEHLLARTPWFYTSAHAPQNFRAYKSIEDVISYAWEQAKHAYREEIFEVKPNTKLTHMADVNRKYFN